MTQTASLTICQYCEHANPVDAKFCAGCGAPLHLIPCPQCGAVNQKASKTCYQCRSGLRESTEILPANAPANDAEMAATDAFAATLPSHYEPMRSSHQRQPLLVVVVIFLTFAAAAYFAYQQRGAVESKTPSVDAGAVTGKVPEASPANASAGAINKVLPGSKPPATLVPSLPADPGNSLPNEQPTTPVDLNRSKAVDSRDTAAMSIPPSNEITRSNAKKRNANTDFKPSRSVTGAARTGSEKNSPYSVAPCTEAVAALGLCTTTTPTKGKE